MTDVKISEFEEYKEEMMRRWMELENNAALMRSAFEEQKDGLELALLDTQEQAKIQAADAANRRESFGRETDIL